MPRTKTQPRKNTCGLRIENGALRVGSDTIFDGCDERFLLQTVGDTRLRSECTDTPIGQIDAVQIAVLGFRGEGNVAGTSGKSTVTIRNGSTATHRHVLQMASQLPSTERFLANARCKLWWMTSTWGDGNDLNEIPPETQFLLLEQSNGKYVAVLPMISSDGFRATLSGHAMDAKAVRKKSSGGNKNSPLCLVAESGCAEVTSSGVNSIICIAYASSPFEATEAVVKAASIAMNESFKCRINKQTPPTTEVFGWCTWDAFYHSVTPKGIERGIHSLLNGGTPAKFVIIDDGWQSVTPDEVYKKKIDHISDHPPVVAGLESSSALVQTPVTPVKHANGSLLTGTGTPHASPSNASPARSGSQSPGKQSVATGKQSGKLGVQSVTPLKRKSERIKRTASRLKKSVTKSVTALASTEVHRGNDRIENAMATALVSVQQSVENAHIPGVSSGVLNSKKWWPVRGAAFVANALGSGLETVYWHGIHGSPYLGVNWWWFKFLGQGLLGPVIRCAVSTLSCFNHRVHATEANVKFRTSGDHVNGDIGELLTQDRVSSKGKRSAHGQGTKSKKPKLGADGFSEVIARMKSLGVDSVYCWHAFFGYWGGLHPDAEEMRRFGIQIVAPQHTPGLLAVEPSQAWDPITVGGVGIIKNTDDYSVFYEGLHKYLANAGVDGVKVDGQAVVGGLGMGRGGGPAMAKNMHQSLEKSIAKHFPSNGLINCMCHSSENILNFRDSNLARVSDDFYPTNKASHTVHVANVAYNSIFMGEIVVPDWDMFQSHCGQAGALHAAARAVGGCPVYVSDAPGKHDYELLRKLVFPSGKVLRARLPGRPTRDCVFVDPCTDGSSALKIWNKNNRLDSGVVGAFNVQGASWSRRKGIFVEEKNCEFVVAAVKPWDVETLRGVVSGNKISTSSTQSTQFVTMAHRSGEVRVLSGSETWRIKLPTKQWEVFTIVALRVFEFAQTPNAKHPPATVDWAFIGLTGMLNGGGGVLHDGYSDDGKTITAFANVYGCGALAAYASWKPRKVCVNGKKINFQWTERKDRSGVATIPLGPKEDKHRVDMSFQYA